MSDTLLKLISDPNFIDFISTFGLGVVLVLYFVFVRDPRHTKYWQSKYDDLSDSYKELSDDYKALEARLDPEKREMSDAQTVRLTHLALDRDLYKLHYLASGKLDRGDPTAVKSFIQESILDTNDTWSKFKSPFPRVPLLSDLYGVYMNGGADLTGEIEEILSSEKPDQEKKEEMWNKLLENCINMKSELSDNLKKLEKGEEVKPYKEPVREVEAE